MNIRRAWFSYWPVFTAIMALFSLPILFMVVNTSELYGHELNRPAKNFTLLDTQNQPHSLEQHRGRYTFLYFGYLNCDEVCHNQVGVMFNISQHTQLNNVDFIFVGMDPERDTPKQLDTYFNQLGDNFYALYHPNMQTIQQLAQSYHAPFFVGPKSDTKTSQLKDYEITHPGYLYLIDPQGQIRVMYPNMHLRYDYILKDLNWLKANKLQ